MSPEGIIEKEATEVNIHEVEVLDPLYIEPEFNQKYIVFLAKDQNFNNYFGAIEPFSILINNDGEAEFNSNLIEADHGELTTTLQELNGHEVEVSTHVEGEIVDDISGETVEELVELIEEYDE
ncbi:hypothetical protein MM221_10125 [Salipaludibacillus sp. LMS25]|uniref:hypothetical protein n=1 Tax=Salipaludibacillus sp. LMS25 TaxID=2924031 RepID=UPI0020D14822|nr:hypothetical protein [Salipaludibacillus sp. LMS25]UTR16831.1 hypothetical protein MM221_10125 [Salipaludibacillus sp. LMS25]